MPRPILLLAALLPVLSACSDHTAEPPILRPAVVRMHVVDEEADAARELLEWASPALVAGAFRRLEAQAYTVDVLFQELDEDGATTRSRRRTIRREPDSTGVDRQTLLGEVLAGQGGPMAFMRHMDPVEILLPADPPYLRPGPREDYAFRLIPDRTMDGRRLRGAQATRRPGVDEPIRMVRGWVDALTGEPAAIEVYRSSSSVLLTEEVRVNVTLAPAAGAGLRPDVATIDARLRVLGQSQRHYLVRLALGEATKSAA